VKSRERETAYERPVNRERERERGREGERKRGRERERETVWVSECVCEREDKRSAKDEGDAHHLP